MPPNERKRQEKLTRQAAKRKERQRTMRGAAASASVALSPVKQMPIAAESPIHECFVPRELFESGIGSVVFSRKLPAGNIAVAVFLVDVFCLGVKDALFKAIPEVEYQVLLQGIRRNETLQRVEPACGRKLVEEAEAYARDLGFSPHPDYQFCKRIFGDVDPAACRMEFRFGKDGKPFYVSGPYDTPGRSKRVIDTLTKRLGRGGFDVMIALGDPFAPPDEEELVSLSGVGEDEPEE